jgi:hypothetical protein
VDDVVELVGISASDGLQVDGDGDDAVGPTAACVRVGEAARAVDGVAGGDQAAGCGPATRW